MRNCVFSRALPVLLFALSTPHLLAQQRNLGVAPAAANELRVALVIGNSAYKESPLANPVNDAADIANALQDAGFKVILRRNANTRDMRQAIREFGTELRRAQVGLFYFAGHGIQVKGNNYLVPVGSDIETEADAEDLAIDANYALRTMEEAQVKVSIVILDACRNNPFARSFRSASRGLAQMSAAAGSFIAFATAPGSVAADGKGRNGMYTKHLLASLSQPDTNLLQVFQRTRAGVVTETGGKQTPWESTSLVGDFYFRQPAGGQQVGSAVSGAAPAAAAPSAPIRLQSAAEIEQQLWDTIKDSGEAREFENYLASYPSGRFAVVARARVRTLHAAAALVQGQTKAASNSQAQQGSILPAGTPGVAPTRDVIVNGQTVSVQTLQNLQKIYPAPIVPGRYWYDPMSGAYGNEGSPILGQMLPGLALGGPLRADASRGTAGVFINGRQITHVEKAYLEQTCQTVVAPGRYWVNAQGMGGIEGGPVSFNLALCAPPGRANGGSSTRTFCDPDGSCRSSGILGSILTSPN